ncbi:MAG: PaaI family thioesterase [Acidobacteriota bacterium]|nr:PaaI family thioesterase [Acidobacteriota bacterium]
MTQRGAAEEHYRRLERMYEAAPINRWLEPRLRISEGTAQVVMPVRDDMFHAAGAVHGSLLFKMLDDAAFFAVNSLVRDVFVLTVSFNVYFTRPVSAGEITASGRVVHRTRRLFVGESALADEGGAEIARGSGSFVTSRFRLSEQIGYR